MKLTVFGGLVISSMFSGSVVASPDNPHGAEALCPVPPLECWERSCCGIVADTVQLTNEPYHAFNPATNGSELVYSSGGYIISSIRGVVARGGHPDINRFGEVVYVTGSPYGPIVSSTQGQVVERGGPPAINGLGEVVYVAGGDDGAGGISSQIWSTERGQLTFIISGPSLWSPENPAIDDSGRVVFSARSLDEHLYLENLWEVDSAGNLVQLTFTEYPLRAIMPTLAASTGELVYVLYDESIDEVSLVSETEGVIFSGGHAGGGAGVGLFPDLSPCGLLVFHGEGVDLTAQIFLGVRTSNGQPDACTLAGLSAQCEDDLAQATTTLAACQADLQQAKSELAECVSHLSTLGVDTDNDGRRDLDDACPDTPEDTEVDQAGCSLDQFCSRFDAADKLGRRLCKKADWKNDEPLMRRKEADCAIDKGDRGREDDQCVARVE